MMSLVSNPAWVTSAIADSFEDLERKIPAEWLPKLTGTTRVGQRTMVASMREYGCGAHGCVLPTLSDDVVLKVTDDESEAQFAINLAPTLVAPIVVEYFTVVALSAKRKGQPLYLLWRESATNVGEVDEVVGMDAEIAINRQHKLAQQVYVAFQQHRLDAAAELAEQWAQAALEMARFDAIKPLALGMVQIWEEQSIFFGDLHGGNLGMVQRDGADLWVITDPGHVVVLDDAAMKVMAAPSVGRQQISGSAATVRGPTRRTHHGWEAPEAARPATAATKRQY